jgi:hypothetical protein
MSMNRALESGAVATDPQRLAFEVYNDCLSIDTPDVRFVSLMMAIECLIEQQRRPIVMQGIVRRAMSEARDLEPGPERQSFLSSLGHLLDESISAAGRRLVGALDSRITYMGETPEQFFRACYNLRSALVHGSGKRPSPEDVDRRAADLEAMVSDLLSLPLLGVQPTRFPPGS